MTELERCYVKDYRPQYTEQPGKCEMQGQPLDNESTEAAEIAPGENAERDCQDLCNAKGFLCPAWYMGADQKCHLVTVPLFAKTIRGTNQLSGAAIDQGYTCHIKYQDYKRFR